MERAAAFARIGNQILGFIASIMILTMFAYGGYSLWDVYSTFSGAFVSSDLLKFKPGVQGNNAPTFEELRKINRDVKAWITVDDTHIDYPVVQGSDDMEYVNKDVYGEFSLSGAIFISAHNKQDFSDSYNLLYGHHMDNGGMFGDVMEFIDEDYFNKHRTGKLFLPDETFDIEIYALIECDAYDRYIYNVVDAMNDMDGFQTYIRENATHYRDIDVKADDRIISLSTCVDAQTNGRAVVLGRMISTEQTD
ncbi:class B sortase [Oribacterium sp. WCC10]|uniref:class B sortase n=1 Tax=Oribacterium sp. WCC10 TaxID=1855343 RepID=UPI0008E5F566|nr:class B sortase [Oribacterium sp. WCC10]SFG08006.1 sortase B [Oribacterium sp. WCC10]